MIKIKKSILFEVHGLSIYDYIVNKCTKNKFVTLKTVFEELLFIEDNSVTRRDFRHYRAKLDDMYINGVIDYVLTSSKNGIVLSDGYNVSKQITKKAKKQLHRAKLFRLASKERSEINELF